MKRTEMLKEIMKVLEKWQDCKFEDRMAEQVLKKIEKKGMLPPEITKIDPGHFIGDEFEYPANEWESEDNEKK